MKNTGGSNLRAASSWEDKLRAARPEDFMAPAPPPEPVNDPGLMSDIRRATGQFVSGTGSTLRDLGAEGVGGAIEQYGTGVVRRNPSEIMGLEDVLRRPFTTTREAVGEVAPQVGLALGGRVVGGLLGLPFGPGGVAAGQFLGSLLPIGVQTYGGIRSSQREKGIEDKGLAAAVTIPAALLERFGGIERVALRVAGEGTQFLAREAGTSLVGAASRQFLRGGVEEALTELPQTALERIGSYEPLTGDDAIDDYAVAGAKGFLGGGSVRAGLSTVAGTRPAEEPLVTIQPDGTITTTAQTPEGETDLTGGQTTIMTPELAAQRIQARRAQPLPDSAFTEPSAERDLFGTVGGPAPVIGEQMDMFGAGGQLAPTDVDPAQGDLFAAPEAAFPTRITAALLDNLGLPRQSSYYRQLVGRDITDPARQQELAQIVARVRADQSLSPRTREGVERLAMQAFGALAQQQEMIGPRGGAIPQGQPSTQRDAPGPVENILPTQPLGQMEPQATVAPETQVAVDEDVSTTPEEAQRIAQMVRENLTVEERQALARANAQIETARTEGERRAAIVQATSLVTLASNRAQGLSSPVSSVPGVSESVGGLPAAAPAVAGLSQGAPVATAPSIAPAPASVDLTQAASTWDRSNRTRRNSEWMEGAAEANPAFVAVESAGATVPAHGMAKAGTLTEALGNLLAMLQGGIRQDRTLYYESLTNPLRGPAAGAGSGTAGGVAYRDGPFIITFRSDLNGRQPTSADITGVLVNPVNAELVAPLQQMFPGLVIRDYNGVADLVSASLVGEARGTQTTEAQQTEAQGQEAAVAEPELTAQDNQAILDLIEQSNNRTDTGRALPAEVRADQRIAAPGRVSFTNAALGRIRDGLVKGKEGLSQREQRVVDALNAFADAYGKYLNVGGNIRRGAGGTETGERIRRKGSEPASAKLDAAAANVRAALVEVGNAVGGNAKDIEAVVRLVKNMAQGKIAVPGRTRADVVKAMQKLDVNLSAAWNAAKREVFRGAKTDTADVRGQVIRPATEQKDKRSPIETAVTDGYFSQRAQNIVKKEVRLLREKLEAEGVSKKEIARQTTALSEKRTAELTAELKGLEAALQYIIDSGTPFTQTLATALRDTIADQSREGKAKIKVKFIDKGDPRFDPKSNTIFLRRAESPEVILHETLHAALQSYIYQNPKDPAVIGLKKSLKQVIDYKGELGADAKKVQTLLQNLVKEGNELDAVLELISYGTTFNEFRRAMQAMPSKGTPKSFFESVSSVWNYIRDILSNMLGVKNTVANDVLDASMMLLERSSKRSVVTGLGNVLTASVRSDGTVDVENMPLRQAAQNPSLAPMSEMDFTRMSRTVIPQWVSSKVLFDTIGWNKLTALADDKIITPLNNWIQKNSPGMTKAISWVNSHYALPAATKDRLVAALTQAKDLRRGGSGIYEDLANFFATLPPAQNQQVLAYMDAKLQSLRQKSAAPAFPINDTKLKLLADATIDGWWTMAKAEPNVQIREAMAGTQNADGTWSGGAQFTRSLVFPTSVNQLASSSFGARNIGQLITNRTKSEVNDEAIRFSLDQDGDPILTGDFIGLYKITPTLQARLDKGEKLADIQPDEFISADRLAAEGANGFRADTDYVWELKGKSKDKGFRMVGRLDALSAKATREGARLGHALQNTMAIMANSYSANTLSNSLYDFGRAGKTATPDAVAFDNIEELNRTLNGTFDADGNFTPENDASKWDARVRQNEVVNISDQEAKSETVKGLYRNRNKWVRLPKGPTYGKLGGKIVNGAVWSAIEDMSDRRPLVNAAAYNGTLRWFKKAKTIYNPATWGTNVASNVTMAMMDDIPMATLAHASRLYALYHLSPQKLSKAELDLMVKIKATNALLGDFSSNEVKQSIYESMKSSIDGPEGGIPQRVMQFFKLEKERSESLTKMAGKGKDAAAKFDELAVAWYAAQDNVFRVASMLNKLGQAQAAGKPMDAETFRLAGDHARFAFLDYDIDSKAVRIMRQTAFPFISWPYAAAKLIGNVAVHRPWKLVNLYAGYWMIEAVMQSLTGDDDEEDEAKRKVGPEWARERLLMGYGPHASIRVPFLGDDENPVFYNVGKYMIPSSFGERVPNGFMGQSWWPSFLSPGGPFVTAAVTVVGGVDPFDGRPLSPPTATNWEAASDRLKYMQSMFVPNLPIVNTRETDKFLDVISGRTDKTDNHAALYFARLAGMRFYDYNLMQAEISQSRAAQAIMREYKAEISKIRRAEARLENPDWDSFYEKQTKLYERMIEAMAKARGED